VKSWREDLRAALPGWVAGRLLVAAAWFVTLAVVEWRLDGLRPVTTSQGLVAWDGAYYREIAEGGYDAVERGGIRFHPLLPLLGRSGIGVLLVANLGALLAGALMHRLVLEETSDRDLARRSATLVGIAGPAFATVWAYAEGPFLALAAAQLLALRRQKWWLAALLGALASLTRPTGVFLLIPAVVEVVRRRAYVAGAFAAVVAPVAGMAGYLLWIGDRYGDAWEPVRIQADLRGGTVFPPFRLVEGLGEMIADPLGDGLHVPFAFAVLALAWVAWRKLPLGWALLAITVAVVNVSADNLNSTERYAYGTVPLLVALGVVVGGRRWRPAVVLSSLLLVGMATLAWYGRYVP
jgi:hypothetical protein